MRSIKVTELKTHLIRYLRQAFRGEPLSWRDRLVREGRLQPGTQDWGALKISTIGRQVDIQSSLGAVREDPGELRGRQRGADAGDSECQVTRLNS